MYVCKIEGGWRIPVWAFIVRAAYTRWPLTKRLPVTPLLAARFLFIDLFSRRRAPMFAPLFFFLFLSLFSSRRRIKGKFNDDLPIFENPCDFSILSPLCLGTGTCANLELRAIINPAKVEFTRENLLNGRRGAVWDSVSHLISFLPFPRSKGGNFERIERGFDKTRYYNNPSFQYFVK